MVHQGVTLVLCATQLLLACGGKSAANNPIEAGAGASGTTGGATGAGGAGGGVNTGGNVAAGGTTISMPPECQTIANVGPAVAVPVVFNLDNHGTATQYLSTLSRCTIEVKIYSCADGYQTVLASQVGCMSSCDFVTSGCVACGMCIAEPVAIDPNSSVSTNWTGRIYSVLMTPACPCYNATAAPSGMYRASIDVYADYDAALNGGTPTKTVSVDFDYPALGGSITIEL